MTKKRKLMKFLLWFDRFLLSRFTPKKLWIRKVIYNGKRTFERKL